MIYKKQEHNFCKTTYKEKTNTVMHFIHVLFPYKIQDVGHNNRVLSCHGPVKTRAIGNVVVQT